MLRVALTGGIATGKSYVLARLAERGVPTIDADAVVHDALRAGTAVSKAVADRFGPGVLKPDGDVDRARLGEKVFAEPERRRQLEAIVHPAVYAAIKTWYATLKSPLGVASIPLLYETHRDADFDFVAATVCSPEQQLRRIVLRDGLSEEEARRRITAQMPAEQKAQRANFVIRTEGTPLDTDRQIDALLDVLRARGAGPF